MDDKKKIEQLEKELELYRNHSDVRAFFALNRVLNQYVNYLNEFDLKVNIAADPKTDKIFDRAAKIIDGLAGLADQVSDLKTKLNLTGDEREELDKRPSFISKIAADRR